MQYFKFFEAHQNHIDAIGQVSHLFYLHYLENCRHDFISEKLDFDIVAHQLEGTLLMLSNFSMEFYRQLKKGDRFIVTCNLLSDPEERPSIHLQQGIILNGKTMATAIFSYTCMPRTGGHPFLTKHLLKLSALAPRLSPQGQ